MKYAYTTIPTYPSGQIGFIIATVDSSKDLTGIYYQFFYFIISSNKLNIYQHMLK